MARPEKQDRSVKMDMGEGVLHTYRGPLMFGGETSEITGTQGASYIELLQIDMTELGGGVYCITSQFQDPFGASGVYPDDTTERGFYPFKGERFYYTPFETSGWEFSSTGSAPTPTITIADINGTLLDEIYKYNNLLGAKVRRWIVSEYNIYGYIDQTTGQNEPSYRGPEEFIITQKTESTPSTHSFKLGTFFAARQMMFPRRNMTRDNFPGMARLR